MTGTKSWLTVAEAAKHVSLSRGTIYTACVEVPIHGEMREGTMIHQPWCSVDMRNVRRTVRVVQK